MCTKDQHTKRERSELVFMLSRSGKEPVPLPGPVLAAERPTAAQREKGSPSSVPEALWSGAACEGSPSLSIVKQAQVGQMVPMFSKVLVRWQLQRKEDVSEPILMNALRL